MNELTRTQVRSSVAKRFGLDLPPSAIRVLDPYKALLRHGPDELLYKRHATLDPEAVEALEHLYLRCIEYGLCPDFLRSLDGRVLVPLSGSVHSVQKLLARDQVPVEADGLARLLTRFHQLAASLTEANILNHFDKMPALLADALPNHGLDRFQPLVREIDRLRASGPTVCHGDLHPGNVIVSGGRLLLLDLDSAARSVPEIDVAFAAFRVFDAGRERQDFLRACGLDRGRSAGVWSFLVYSILQRLVFILESGARGDHRWDRDLDNQRGYLRRAERLMAGNNGS